MESGLHSPQSYPVDFTGGDVNLVDLSDDTSSEEDSDADIPDEEPGIYQAERIDARRTVNFHPIYLEKWVG